MRKFILIIFIASSFISCNIKEDDNHNHYPYDPGILEHPFQGTFRVVLEKPSSEVKWPMKVKFEIQKDGSFKIPTYRGGKAYAEYTVLRKLEDTPENKNQYVYQMQSYNSLGGLEGKETVRIKMSFMDYRIKTTGTSSGSGQPDGLKYEQIFAVRA